MENGMKTTTLIGIAIVLTIVAALLLSLSNIAKQQRVLAVNTFADCKAAGYPIMESYPEQCRTPDGRTFVNDEQQIVASGCQVGGCSAQLCGEIGVDLVSNCEYRPEYACYQDHSSCERQLDGTCGWTPNDALATCIASSTAATATE